MSTEVVLVSGPAPAGGFAVPGTEQVIDASFAAGRVSLRPDEYQFNGRIMGHYSATFVVQGIATASIASVVLAMRNIDSTALLVIKRVRHSAVVTAALTTGIVDMDLAVGRGLTAAYTTSAGTSPAVANDTAKTRQSMGPSILGTAGVQVTNAAAGLTGTPVGFAVDGQALSAWGLAPISGTAAVIGAASNPVTAFDTTQQGQHPLVLRANEALLFRHITALGGTGALKHFLSIDWLEAVAY